MLIWFKPPGLRPADVEAASSTKDFDISRPKHHPSLTGAKMWYCLLQFALILQISTHFLGAYPTVTIAHALAYALWLIAGLWIVGGLMEHRTRFLKLEAARLTVTLLTVSVTKSWFGTLDLPAIAQGLIGAVCLSSLAALWIIFGRGNAARAVSQ